VGRPAVFLDRDGTINVRPAEHDYVRDVRDFQWLPGALDGMAKLAGSKFPLVVVSNQRGIARGLVTFDTLGAIEAQIQQALGDRGYHVDAFRYCVHDLDDHCDCRKPQPGLLLSAARELQLDLPRSWMIGDTKEDMEAGRAAGCRTILITADASEYERTAESVFAAASIVLGEGDTDGESSVRESA
jgi:D-glycero-D-manno-heptose 1,7-bisphosphate phosphatase